jgi:hypothetical protein
LREPLKHPLAQLQEPQTAAPREGATTLADLAPRAEVMVAARWLGWGQAIRWRFPGLGRPGPRCCPRSGPR